MSGARADQANVTLDGVDNNDPVFNTAYTRRPPLDAGFAPGVPRHDEQLRRRLGSLLRRAGVARHEERHERLPRIGATTSCAGRRPRPTSTSTSSRATMSPKLDKNIYGGAFGGALIKDKLFFFGNYERLKEDSEALTRTAGAVALDAGRRDGVPVCRPGAVPWRNGAGFREQPRDPGWLLRRDARRSSPASTRSASAPACSRPSISSSFPRRTTPGSTATTSWPTSSRRRSATPSTRRSGASITGPGATRASSGASTCSAIRCSTCPSTRTGICRRTRRARSRAGARRSAGTRC